MEFYLMKSYNLVAQFHRVNDLLIVVLLLIKYPPYLFLQAVVVYIVETWN